MTKKYGLCALILLLAAHGITLSMMHTKKIMKSTSRLQLQKRVCSENARTSNSLMSSHDRFLIREAYIDSIYKVAQFEAMCKIHTNSNLDIYTKKELLNLVPRIIHE
jgi:hypothetical protein